MASIKHNHERDESKALYFGAAAALVSGMLAWYFFIAQAVPLFGAHSIASVASVLAAVAAFAGFCISWREPGLSGRGRRFFNRIALAFVEAGLWLLLVVTMYYLAQTAFYGLKFDVVTAAVLVGLSAGLAGHTAYLSGTHLTSARLSSILGVFLVAGAGASMITSPNPYWWQLHFSSLGGGHSPSATSFNLTLLVGGLAIASLADAIAIEFGRLMHLQPSLARARVGWLRASIAAIGLCLACVGLFAYDTHLAVHHAAASAMGLIFLSLAIGLPWIAPGFARTLYVVSYILASAVFLCAWLFLGTGYFNLTAFELLLASIVFAWIIVLVRYIAVRPR